MTRKERNNDDVKKKYYQDIKQRNHYNLVLDASYGVDRETVMLSGPALTALADHDEGFDPIEEDFDETRMKICPTFRMKRQRVMRVRHFLRRVIQMLRQLKIYHLKMKNKLLEKNFLCFKPTQTRFALWI